MFLHWNFGCLIRRCSEELVSVFLKNWQLHQKLEAEFNSHALFQSNPTSVTRLQLDKARLDLDLFLSDSADKILSTSRHRFYCRANKFDTLLARTLQNLDRPSKPIRLKLSWDTYSRNPVKILHTFQKQFASLNRSLFRPDSGRFFFFFSYNITDYTFTPPWQSWKPNYHQWNPIG